MDFLRRSGLAAGNGEEQRLLDHDAPAPPMLHEDVRSGRDERMSKMINVEPYTFIFGIVNLIVLYIILRLLLFKRVTNFINNRTNSIKTAISDAEDNLATSEATRQKYEELLKGARVEANKIVDESRSKSYREYDAMINKAREDAAVILTKAREEIDYEKSEMIKDVRNQVATLALSAASKVIEANMDTETNKALVKKFLDETGAA